MWVPATRAWRPFCVADAGRRSRDNLPRVPSSESHERRIWIDGTLVPWADATVHVLSHSLQRGSLVFDYLSVHRTPRGVAVFRLPEHVERFLASCALVGLPIGLGAAEIQAAVGETVRANPGARSVKVCAYLPSIEVEVVPMDDRVSVAVAAYDPTEDIVKRKPRPAPHRPELRLWIEKQCRNRRHDIVPPQAKVAANYLSSMTAKLRARKAGYDEIVLVDEEGHLGEGPTTNVFLLDALGELRTPALERVLPGVTRRSVIELAKHDGVPVHEGAIEPAELLEAAEVFLTATSAGLWPVVQVDERRIGDGRPGPVTRRLREHFERVVSGRDPAFEHWLHVVES
jgi:branched-chain amino acid aminotransferase